jgi:2,4-dienoyl-CoA reductase-like NADH-dependent reductase (Old Yellow Enzyme family)/thioredoxin reductase
MAFDMLFSPVTIRGMELRNRVVMSAMSTHFAGGDDGKKVTDRMIAFHVARARGGLGLNTVECTCVDGPSANKRELCVADDSYIPGLRRLCDAVHEAGGKIGIQLYQPAVAGVMDPDAELLMADMLDEDRIAGLIRDFGLGAARCAKAGFDMVELHAAHNYIVHSFLSDGFNHRTDKWGGSFENRLRFPLAVIKSMRDNMPESMPLFMRVDCHDDAVPEGTGLTVEDTIAFCRRAKELGADVLNVSRGNCTTPWLEVPPLDLPHGLNTAYAARIRRETGMLTMPAGRINTPEFAENLLEKDMCDLVVMSRAQLADPEFCNKAKAGRLSAIKYCIGCVQGCYDYYVDPDKEHITCVRNPAVGEEEAMKLVKAEKPRRVLIVGGGIGGMEAADILKKRGHIPVLCEASGRLGGQMALAGAAPRKEDTLMAAEMAAQNLADIGVEVRLNTKVTPEYIDMEGPDAVILAAGAVPSVPDIPGINGKNVFSAADVLSGKAAVSGRVTIIGGGMVGIETAEYLFAKGCRVTVLEMTGRYCADMASLRAVCEAEVLKKTDIKILLNSRCLEVREGSVTVGTEEGETTVETDFVVTAVGSESVPCGDLESACAARSVPCYVVGDANQPGRILNAVRDAYLACMEI